MAFISILINLLEDNPPAVIIPPDRGLAPLRLLLLLPGLLKTTKIKLNQSKQFVCQTKVGNV
jgi:hypothetical protein